MDTNTSNGNWNSKASLTNLWRMASSPAKILEALQALRDKLSEEKLGALLRKWL
jgi:hypothetical protein